MDLKYIIFVLLIITSVITVKSYKEVWHDEKSWLFGLISVDAGFAPTKWWFIFLFLSSFLLAIGFGLGESQPIIINF
jgi:hypothetical protein